MATHRYIHKCMKYGIMLVAVKCLNMSTGCLSCRALNSDSASSCSSTAGHIGSIECLCTTDVEKNKKNKQTTFLDQNNQA